MGEAKEIFALISQARRDMPRNQLVARLCDELEKRMIVSAAPDNTHQRQEWMRVGGEIGKAVSGRGKFDRNAYQRELMRKRRAAAKNQHP